MLISKEACECLKKSKRLDFFRHGYVSLLINMNFSILTVSNRLGRENIQMTLNIYTKTSKNSYQTG